MVSDSALPEGYDSGKHAVTACYKRPQSVLVVVYTSGGDVLLMNRTRPSGFWQSVTGSLRWGETARHAAERELYEETGIPAQGHLHETGLRVRFPIKPAWRARYQPGVTSNVEHWFFCRLPARRLIRLNPTEHLTYRWLPPDRAMAQVASWTNRDAIEQLARARLLG